MNVIIGKCCHDYYDFYDYYDYYVNNVTIWVVFVKLN
jgi:hypothetical protein